MSRVPYWTDERVSQEAALYARRNLGAAKRMLPEADDSKLLQLLADSFDAGRRHEQKTS